MDANRIFRKAALDRMSSPEQLDQLLRVTAPRTWLALTALLLCLGAALAWGYWGRVTTTIEAPGILVASGGIRSILSPLAGQVSDLRVGMGERVAAGQVIAIVAPPQLLDRLQAARADPNELALLGQQLDSLGTVVNPYNRRVDHVAVSVGAGVPAGSPIARHLCSSQLLDGPQTGGWPCTFASRPLAGFSHGASGIAYALARLHAVTGGAHLIDAARRAVEFERAAYVSAAGNWIDYRRESESPACMTSWCHGAPGIALARLALVAEIPGVLDELSAALETTARPQPHSVDHVCCGSFGRFDVLRYASSLLGRPDFDAAADEQAFEALRHAPAFRVHPADVPQVINPGFFDGLSGIGYVLLRLSTPGALPSVLAFD